jgi:hypothetical protein
VHAKSMFDIGIVQDMRMGHGMLHLNEFDNS